MLAGISSLTRLCGHLRRSAAAWLLPLALGAAGAAVASTPPDTLTMLVPDGANLASWEVKVWTDTAAEEGIRLQLITDSQLLALGSAAASRIPGLIVPDSAHIRASDAVINAIKSYAYTGGKLMLVYDAGVLNEAGFYPLNGPSRFSDMVGVNYAMYSTLLDRVVGFGPIMGTKARLDSLRLPPGKYLPYSPPASLTSTATATATTAFVPTSQYDPGGTQWMRAKIQERALQRIDEGSKNVRELRRRSLRDALGLDTPPDMPVRYGQRVLAASAARDQHMNDLVERTEDDLFAAIESDDAYEQRRYKGNKYESGNRGSKKPNPDDYSLQTISGYAYGSVGYFSYVTTGTFPGTVYLSSPEHGLVAGVRTYGSGRVTFVNMPLGYFKAIGTDSAPLHGFLNLFAREQMGVTMMSAQPRGVGGLVFNWHIDDGDDLVDDTKDLLDNTRVLRRGPFSLHFTAGPDVIQIGDGNGMDLAGSQPKAVAARDLVRRLGNTGAYAGRLPVQHELGSHGGWIHDYWGELANEQNVPDFTPLLEWNFAAIEAVTGRRILEYSSPQGNTPLWALNWLERRGVKAAYTAGDGGASIIRSWRAGSRVADRLWSVPVTPQGKYATFEEFEEFGISDPVSVQWLLDLQTFAVNHRTNRMFYAHPPGVRGHLKAINPILDRAEKLQNMGDFRWYTMAQLAEFAQRRVETSWSSTSSGGTRTYDASHPASLADVTWLLRRDRFATPSIVSGSGRVTWDATHWVVTANGGTRIVFSAPER